MDIKEKCYLSSFCIVLQFHFISEFRECKFGKFCNYAHGESELRRPANTGKVRLFSIIIILMKIISCPVLKIGFKFQFDNPN
jgi:hypothetical protein